MVAWPAWISASLISCTSSSLAPPAVTRTLPRCGTRSVFRLPAVTSTSTTMLGLTRRNSSLPRPRARMSSRLRGAPRSRLNPSREAPSSPSLDTSSTAPLRRSTCGPSADSVATEVSPTIRTRRPTARTETRSTPLVLTGLAPDRLGRPARDRARARLAGRSSRSDGSRAAAGRSPRPTGRCRRSPRRQLLVGRLGRVLGGGFRGLLGVDAPGRLRGVDATGGKFLEDRGDIWCGHGTNVKPVFPEWKITYQFGDRSGSSLTRRLQTAETAKVR